MTTLSNEAFAVMAACERTKQPFGITVDKICSGQYKFVWAFKIDKEKAQREGCGKTNVKGNIILDTEYPGCPYCGEKRHSGEVPILVGTTSGVETVVRGLQSNGST